MRSKKDKMIVRNVVRSSPSAIRQLSSRLCRSNRQRFALTILSPPNFEMDVEAFDGFSTILPLFGKLL